jgi:hypothetical protein
MAELARRHTGYGDFSLPIRLYPKGLTENAVEEGITWIKSLAHGDHPREINQEFDRQDELRRRFRDGYAPRNLEEAAEWTRLGILETSQSEGEW